MINETIEKKLQSQFHTDFFGSGTLLTSEEMKIIEGDAPLFSKGMLFAPDEIEIMEYSRIILHRWAKLKKQISNDYFDRSKNSYVLYSLEAIKMIFEKWSY